MADINGIGFDFLKTELHTGLTLAQIAIDAGEKAKAERNHANARQAYDTALRTQSKVPLSPEQAEQIAALFQQLRNKLEQLGDSFQ